MNITRRTNREIAEDLSALNWDDIIKVILYVDLIVSDYPFTFNLIKSLLEEVKKEGDYITKEEIWNEIENAKTINIY